MTPKERSEKQLRVKQFERACDLRKFLDGYVKVFPTETRLHTDATEPIRQWLSREYRLGQRNQRRKVKR